MEIKVLLSEARKMWGDQKMSLKDMLVRYGVTFGDLCRYERAADKDHAWRTQEELEKELGNLIFSTIRFCDDLGLDPEACIRRAMEAQQKFVNTNKNR